jgi:hypothetical protein
VALFVLSGAPGSGKTAALTSIRQRLPGVVVVNMDTFLDAASALAGADLRYAADRWPAYNRLCRALLTPLEPREVPDWRPGEVAWAVLDCPDPDRRDRLVRRGMPAGEIDDALRDAAVLRRLGLRSSRPPALSPTPRHGSRTGYAAVGDRIGR